MITEIITTVAVVGRLDDFNVVLTFVLEISQWSPFLMVSNLVVSDW